MATASLIITVVCWVALAGVVTASFVVRRRRASWFRWLCVGLLLMNSGGLMNQFAQDRDWPSHWQIVVSDISVILSSAALALVCVAAWKLRRRNTSVSTQS